MRAGRRALQARKFFGDILRGAAIGVAFIIPGFSGGSVAAILGIYGEIVSSVAEIFRNFKKSFRVLFPIAAGMVLGIALLLFPIRWGLANYPVPTVSLFAGLAVGGLPDVFERAKPKGKRLFAFLAALLASALLAFVPAAAHGEDFLYKLGLGGYLLLFGAGFVASGALVVPGISGSMLLLVLGYYTPLVGLITDLIVRGREPLVSLTVLAVAGAGMLLGTFTFSVAMKRLLAFYPRGTYSVILGLILGSAAAVYGPILRTPSPLFASPWYWLVSVLLMALGAGCSFLFGAAAKRSAQSKRDAP